MCLQVRDETQMQRLDMWPWEGEGGATRKSSSDMHTLPCVGQRAAEKLLFNTGSRAWCCDDLEGVGWGRGGRFKRRGCVCNYG